MQILNQNLNKTISKNFSFPFNVAESGIYLIEIIASCKNWRQNWAHLFNDDDLAVKIDNIEFPKLNKKNGLLNGETAWNGNNLKGAKKIGIFVLNLKSGDHQINFIPNTNPKIHSINIIKAENNIIEYVPVEENRQAEDGNNRQWATIVLSGLALKHLFISAKADSRSRDRDDIKLIINGEIQKNPSKSPKYKNWYWAGNLLEAKEFSKELNLSKGLHYIELWADRMPTLENIKLILETKQEGEERDRQKCLFGKIALYKEISGAVGSANFRSDPALCPGNIIGEIKNGEKVEILEKEVKGEYIENLSDIWHKIKYDGKEGYILSSFIEISGQERNVIVEKIKEEADKMELDRKLMLAIAFQESKFKPFAVSYRGVKGLFQITNAALADVYKETGYEVSDRFNFEQSIGAGLRYYKYIILPKFNLEDKQYLEKTIAAYNLGYNKIPQSKDKKLIYKNLAVEEIKKDEVEEYTKKILNNFQDKNWIGKLSILFLILIIGGFQLYHTKINGNNADIAEASLCQNIDFNNVSKEVVELYDGEDDIYKSDVIEKFFKVNIEDKDIKLDIRENRNIDEFNLFVNDKKILSRYSGIKDLLLWNSSILIARFWGGQTVDNYLFDLKNGGAIIPFVGGGESYDFSGSAGGSWIGKIPVFGEVFFLYYEGGGLCDGAGEIYRLYGDLDGLRMIKLWDMKQSNDWCDNFKG